MKYYKIHHSPKSHCDIPCPWSTEWVKAKNLEDFKRQRDIILRHSEDYDITEVTEEQYENRYGGYGRKKEV